MKFRPTRVDRQATEKRGFVHPRSYVHLNGHEYLRGKDRTRVRIAVFVRAAGRCEFCGQFVCAQGEMHHIKHLTPLERCDCLHNLAWACRACHRKEHGREPQLKWLS